MPCNSDHMQANTRELELSKVACLLGELKGKPFTSGDWGGYHKKVYCKGVSKDQADKMVADLCTQLQKTDVTKFSLEMQTWWRDHQKVDAERKAAEKKAKAAKSAVIPYRMGDVVLLKRKGKKEEEHIIQESQFCGNSFEYSTHRGAWYDHKDMTLVRAADAESLAALRKSIKDEEESEED